MIQFARGTSSVAASSNSILSAGQPFFETDTNKLKIGNGTASYNDLPYIGGSSGKKYATVVVGTSTAGYTADQVDFLCDGVDDQVEIEQALDSVSSGGLVKLLSGQYKFTNTFSPVNTGGSKTLNNVEIVGEGYSTILDFNDFHPTYTGGACGFNVRGNNVAFKNLHFITPQEELSIDTMYACILSRVTNLTVSGVIFEGYVNPLNIRGSYNMVSNCMFLDYGYNGDPGDYTLYSNCIFRLGDYSTSITGNFSDSNNMYVGCMFIADHPNNSMSMDTNLVCGSMFLGQGSGGSSKIDVVVGNYYKTSGKGPFYYSSNRGTDKNKSCVVGNYMSTGSGPCLYVQGNSAVVGNSLQSGGETSISGTDSFYPENVAVVGNLFTGTMIESGGSGSYSIDLNTEVQ